LRRGKDLASCRPDRRVHGHGQRALALEPEVEAARPDAHPALLTLPGPLASMAISRRTSGTLNEDDGEMNGIVHGIMPAMSNARHKQEEAHA